MHFKTITKYLANALLIMAPLLLVPCLVGLIYKEYSESLVFLGTAVGTFVVAGGLSLLLRKDKANLIARDGMAIAALIWILYSVIGALPFYISGTIPSIFDAIFESASGFSTTGSTILNEIEGLPYSMLFWRSFTHWVGGMGVLVLAIAIFPTAGNAMFLMRAECSGSQVGKLVPKGRKSAAILYGIYTALTIITVLLLKFGGMTWFDALCHGMGTAGTGGFGTKNNGFAYFSSPYLQWVTTIMMIVFGVNFQIYYCLLLRRFTEVKRNTELKFYFGIIAVMVTLISINTYHMYHGVEETVRTAAFQVGSLMTSTGFATVDFNYWPMFSQFLLVLLIFVGACGGSTGGGFKVRRVVILGKYSAQAIRRILHPGQVHTLQMDGKRLSEEESTGVVQYLILYLALLIASMILVSLDNQDFATTFTSVATCLNNIGPGLSSVGPMNNFSLFSPLAKVVLSVDMILGRLECLPILVLFSFRSK